MNIGKRHIGSREILVHSIFWLTWIVSFTFIQTLNEGIDSWLVWLMYYIITLPIFVVHTYLIAYWLLPLTFFKGRYLFFSFGILVFLFFFSVLELLVSNFLVFGIFDKPRMFGPTYLNFQNIVISGIGNHYIILVFLAIKAGGSWYRTENRREELLRTKEETELEISRCQLQPQMVFTLMDQLEHITSYHSDKAPEMIIKISNFLNGFLFESKDELIPLQKEVKLIEEFLSIHTHALDGKVTSNFIVSGNLNPFLVPPLLLLPILNGVLNIAYKCNNSFESTVIIKAEKKYLLFSFTFWSDQEFRLTESKNIELTKKRLKYNFPGKHRLVENIDDNFIEFSIEIFT
ncbi:histidine kinase [uncultured Draconibacterium sp.]|uniref:histidine kinase n=1 Tax=uncultured Draconibacterium sp. TaxID=1573823 RepID=UPI00321710F5